ncbi:MAG: hypothetical protein JXA82_09900 [Sedimentisphaerales bacterium]|nr:hypothetical protein [Sedimentisphaerales bacterium]
MILAKDNPFRVSQVKQIRYQHESQSWDQLLQRLEDMKYYGAIVGPCGSGKTTLLEDLQIHLHEIHVSTQYIFVSMDVRPSRSEIQNTLSQPADVVLLDGADHFSRRTWQNLKNRIMKVGRGLVVTSHKPDLLPTWVRCQPSPQRFIEITEQLLRSIDQHPFDSIFLEHLFFQHKGNIRDALRALYDIMASGI